MSNRTPLIWGTVLVTLGLLGIATVWVFQPAAPSLTSSGTYSSSGQIIYYTGADAKGPIPRNVGGSGIMGLGMMANATCIDCHGEDGRGGRVGMMFGTLGIPDIRYSSLASPRSEEGTTIPAWTDSDIRRAIRDGVEPDGQRLKSPMPRWDMTDQQLTDVIDYLKELDAR